MATDAPTATAPDIGTGHSYADADATDPGPAIPDSVLLAGVIAGSQPAFGQLYDRHVDAVYRASLRVSSDRSTADEVVQETFLVLWDRAELFDPTRGSLRAWLATIARNRAVDHLRRAGRQPATAFASFGMVDTDDVSTVEWLARTGSLVGGSGPERTPEEALADGEIRGALIEALASIAPSERQVIDLAYREGLTQSEIADRLDWPLGTVKTRTRRALRLLRERLELAERSGRRPSGVDYSTPKAKALARSPRPTSSATASPGRRSLRTRPSCGPNGSIA
jgi:RNA polymerase sigma-70 factor (ECF subfamily)